MTGADILARVKANLGNRDDLDTEIYAWINIAQRHMVGLALEHGHEWTSLEANDETQSTTADVREGSLPSNCAAVYDVRLISSNNSRTLVYEPARAVDRNHPYPEDDSTNKPTHYTIWDGEFLFRPIPDDEYPYYVRFCEWPDDIDGDTTTEPIAKSGGVLVAYATALIFTSLQNTEMATFWFTIADGGASLVSATARGQRKPAGLLGSLLRADKYHEDYRGVHKEFRSRPILIAGEPWLDPFVGLN